MFHRVFSAVSSGEAQVVVHAPSTITPGLVQHLEAATALVETVPIAYRSEAQAAVTNLEMRRDVVLGTSGFDVTCTTKPEDDFSCPLCLNLVRDACAHACGQLFCSSCWEAWSETGKGCPCCRQMGEVHPALRDQRTIANILISCNACEEIFRLGDLEKHLEQACKHRPLYCHRCDTFSTPALERFHATQICKYRPIPCPACSEMVEANLMAWHEANECQGRLVECGDCKAKTKAIKLPSHKANHCPSRMVECEMCKQQVKKSQLPSHMTEAAGVHIDYLLRQRERDQQTLVDMQDTMGFMAVSIGKLQASLLLLADRVEQQLRERKQ